MTRWNERETALPGSEYDRRWDQMEAAGEWVHGEADLICSYHPRSVLDAGCGTGRVAIELARRGLDVVGVDLDDSMLTVARAKAPNLAWLTGDLATVSLVDTEGRGRRFDVVALPGNVMIFLAPGSEGAVVANLAGHVEPGGVLISGFELAAGLLGLSDYDDHARAAGLELEDRWSTWDREAFAGGGYAVSVHRRPT